MFLLAYKSGKLNELIKLKDSSEFSLNHINTAFLLSMVYLDISEGGKLLSKGCARPEKI